MSTIRTRALTFLTAGAIAATTLLPSAVAAAQCAPQDTPQLLAAARAATARYHGFDVAVAEGFVPASGCVSSPAGGMGVHYLRPDRLDATLVVTEPEALLYEPDVAGRMRLVGVEYMVVPTPGHPAMFGDEHLHQPDHLPFEVLHVWLWKRNPSGMFADWNPRVTCRPRTPCERRPGRPERSTVVAARAWLALPAVVVVVAADDCRLLDRVLVTAPLNVDRATPATSSLLG